MTARDRQFTEAEREVARTDELRTGDTIVSGAGTPYMVVGIGEDEGTAIQIDLVSWTGDVSSESRPARDLWIRVDGFVSPTYEITRELLRRPYKHGTVGESGLYGFGLRLDPGAPLAYRTYHNDPTYAEIRFIDPTSGETVGLATETWDRIAERDRYGRPRSRRSGQLGSGETGPREETA